MISPHTNVFACEFAARHIEAGANFILGTTAALARDFEFAEQLLLAAERGIERSVSRAEGANMSALLALVRRRISELYLEWLRQLSAHDTSDRDARWLHQEEQMIERLRGYNPHDYSTHLSAAICAFLLHRDVTAARREIEQCASVADGTWRYSEAFLLAYEGDLDAAYRSYRRAFESPIEDVTVPAQSEEFIQGVLDVEPEKYWLFFCLGLINYRAKGDLIAARRDFEAFLAATKPPRFATQITAVRKWLDEIEDSLNQA